MRAVYPDQMMAHCVSQGDVAAVVRQRLTSPKTTLQELYGRPLFDILCGNTDDHARNHAGFREGEYLALTPALDIRPQGRSGNVASQAMPFVGDNRASTLATCLEAVSSFQRRSAPSGTHGTTSARKPH